MHSMPPEQQFNEVARELDRRRAQIALERAAAPAPRIPDAVELRPMASPARRGFWLAMRRLVHVPAHSRGAAGHGAAR